MATEFLYDIGGKRIVMRVPEILPRVGDKLNILFYGKVRAETYTVDRIEWTIAQEESSKFFNKPRSVVVFISPDAKGSASIDDGRPPEPPVA